MTPSLVLLGNLLVDDLVFADGTTRMGQAGGAVLYGALAATLWGARPGLVSVVGDDYPSETLRLLEDRGVDLGGVHRLGRAGVRTWLLYEPGVRRMIHRIGCPTHEDVSPAPEHVPAAWRRAPAFHIAPMPFATQAALVWSLRSGGEERFISIDPHAPVTEASLPAWRELLAHADAFFPGEDELQLDGLDTRLPSALRRLVTGRLQYVACKQGPRGGMLYDVRADRLHAWTAHHRPVVDQTGAGDAFAAGFVTALLERQPVEACLERGAATATFALEAWGPHGLLAATRQEAEARVRREATPGGER